MTPTRRRLLIAAAAGTAGAIGMPRWSRHARAADTPRFTLGVASGWPRADHLVLWTRLTGIDLPERVDVRWELARDEGFRDIAAGGVTPAEAAWAHSVHAEPAGLEPARWYWYRFAALGQRSTVGRTRTAPAPDAPARLDFAIASCQRYDHGEYAAWRHLAGQAPDLVMFLGDYIYEYPSHDGALRAHDGPLLRTLDQYRRRYAQYKSDPALQAAHAACPWLVIWDDHEVENDHSPERGTTLSGSAFAALRAVAYQAWWEHQPVPGALRPVGASARIHHRFDWGRLARIHALDNRQYRDAQACPRYLQAAGAANARIGDCAELSDPRRSMLGPDQEHWLNDGWDRSRPWNLLAQQTLMAPRVRARRGGPDSAVVSTDGWDGYAPARHRLLDGAVARGASNPVVLGGDVHAHFVADLKVDADQARAPVVASEFCTTSISSAGPRQSRVERELALNPHLLHGRGDKRGYIGFTLDERRLEARLMVVERSHDAHSPVHVDARFAVEAGRPGPQRG